MLTDKNLSRGAFGALFFVVAALSFSISLFEISSGIFIGLTLLWVLKFRSADRGIIFKNMFTLFVGLYFLSVLLSLTQSEYLAASARGVFKVLKNIALCFAAVAVIDSEARFKKIFQFFLLGALLIAIDALIQSVVGFDLIRQRRMIPYITGVGRVTGPFQHPNDFSAYLSLVIFLFIGALPEGLKIFSRKKFTWILIGTALVSLCLLWTYSRGAWLAVIVSFVLLTITKKSKFLLAGILLFSVWAVLFSPPLVKARVESIWKSQGGTLVERKALWQESFRMIKKSPVLGLGVNTYAKNEPHFKSGDPSIDNQYAHNGYLQIAAEIGCLGLLSFLLVFSCFFWKTVPQFLKTQNLFLKTAGTAFVFGILAFLIHSAFDTNLQSVLLVNQLWLAMGVTLAASRFA